MLAGNLFSIAFGRNLDAHDPQDKAQLPTRAAPTRQCLEGKECYVATLHLTVAGCFLAILLSVFAGWRDRRKIAAHAIAHKPRQTGLLWENPDE